MKDGQRLVLFRTGGAMHVTHAGSRKGKTLCGRIVPRGRWPIGGPAKYLERAFPRCPRQCARCKRVLVLEGIARSLTLARSLVARSLPSERVARR